MAHRLLPAVRYIRSISLSPPALGTGGQQEVSVRRRSKSWASPLAGALAVVLGLMFAAPPASMAASAEPMSPPARQSLAAATTAKLATLPAPRAFLRAQAAPAPATAGTDAPKSFFRTPTGIAAVVLMVAGAAYVAISIPKDNEKVHSPIR